MILSIYYAHKIGDWEWRDENRCPMKFIPSGDPLQLLPPFFCEKSIGGKTGDQTARGTSQFRSTAIG